MKESKRPASLSDDPRSKSKDVDPKIVLDASTGEPEVRTKRMIPAPGVRIRNTLYVGEQFLTMTEYSEIMGLLSRRQAHDIETILGRRGGTETVGSIS